MTELIAVVTITILAVVSPGPDFAMVTRNSYAFGRRAGLISAIGIACGVQLHVLYTVLGVAVAIEKSPLLFLVMKILGASYLIFLGIKSLTNKSKLKLEPTPSGAPTSFGAFRMGFLTNALNPKTTLFVIATYTQVVTVDSSVSSNFAYGLFISLSHWIWFSVVAYFFSAKALRRIMLDRQSVVDKSIGAILIGLGFSLFFANIAP
ncbi:LysE family translocator [Marinobacter fonticola]|uniref:LysE family translocator n=1 Tax=Marinobacter fonticola TaxID=2603215 RepID=UPI0011E7124E|nr:LysE family transporter [Marinobacter fonticola]